MAVDFKASYAISNLWYGVAAIAKNAVVAGTIHRHGAAVVARLICCRERHFFLTEHIQHAAVQYAT
jgi:hypothetical protein